MKFEFIFSNFAEIAFDLGKSALEKSEFKLAKKYLLESADKGYKPAIELLLKEKENLDLDAVSVLKLQIQKEDYDEKQNEHVIQHKQNIKPKRKMNKADYAVSFDPNGYLYKTTITSKFFARNFTYKLG